MRLIPRRAETEPETPFHTPEQLALAMPLVALIGCMVVVSAVETGGSKPLVALVAVVSFGLCATAPLALIDLYVTRPLRGALAQMRAARDGRASEAAFASGVIADLVHLARDIHAARAVPLPDLPVPPGRAQIVELAEAIKALRAAPAGGLDGAVERLEAMLVYIAESLDRIEAKGGVDQRTADLGGLIARETEIVQGAISSGAFALRTDVAGAVAQEQIGRAQVLGRLDALETRLAARLEPTSSEADALSQTAALGETMVERLSAQGAANAQRLDEIERRVVEQIRAIGRDNGSATMALLAPAAKRIGEAADRLDLAAARPASNGWERLGDDVQAVAKAVDAVAQRLDDAIAGLSDETPMRAWLGEAEARMAGGLADVAARLDAFESRGLTPACGALVGAARVFAAAQARIEEATAKIEAGDPRLAEIALKLDALAPSDPRDSRAQRADFDAEAQVEKIADAVAAQNRETFAALSDSLRGLLAAPALLQAVETLRADFAATASASAEKFDAAAEELTRSVEDKVERLRRGELWPAIAAAQATAQDLHKAHAGLFAHVEALKAALSADRSGFAALRLDVVEAFAAVAAIGERVEYAARTLQRRGDAPERDGGRTPMVAA